MQITVRDEVVAELRAALPEPEPGAAARALLELVRKLPRRRGSRGNISGHVKEYLYGSRGLRGRVVVGGGYSAIRRISTPVPTSPTCTTTARAAADRRARARAIRQLMAAREAARRLTR